MCDKLSVVQTKFGVFLFPVNLHFIMLQCKVSAKRLTGYLQADELEENSVNYSTSSERKY